MLLFSRVKNIGEKILIDLLHKSGVVKYNHKTAPRLCPLLPEPLGDFCGHS